MNIHYIQHVPFEDPGMILNWADEKNYPLTKTCMYKDEALPQQKDFDWLIIMGGPMNVDEENQYPWLKAEKEFILRSIQQGKVVLGICLGAQLIAEVLGGKVTKNPCKEIGWLPVVLTDEARELPLFSEFPKEITVFQWHGDTFSQLPEGAVCLAKSDGCEHQAFIYQKRVLGFQYHLENTENIIQDLLFYCADELIPGAYVQTREEIIKHLECAGKAEFYMRQFLDTLDVLYQEGAI